MVNSKFDPQRGIELDSRAKGLPRVPDPSIAFPRDKRSAKYTAGSPKRGECVGGFSDGNISTPTDQSQPSRRCRRTVPKVADGRSAFTYTKKVLLIGFTLATFSHRSLFSTKDRLTLSFQMDRSTKARVTVLIY